MRLLVVMVVAVICRTRLPCEAELKHTGATSRASRPSLASPQCHRRDCGWIRKLGSQVVLRHHETTPGLTELPHL